MSDNEVNENEVESEIEEFQDAEDSLKAVGEIEITQYGCKHYKCRCAYIAPCCNKMYVCRLCHDEKENHVMNRFEVTEVVCLMCGTKQQVQKNCEKCQVEFGKYFCSICRLFDDQDKQQFHCHACGLCRVGGRDNFFHCEKCDMCLSISLKADHKCVEKVTRANCPVCMDDLHTSRNDLHVMGCGHICHRICFTDMLKSGNFACPLCCHAMVNMSSAWETIDHEIEMTPMPEEYKDTKCWILCRDCHKTCETKFHVIGLKCLHCGSYNTCGTSPQEANAEAPGEEVAPGDGQ